MTEQIPDFASVTKDCYCPAARMMVQIKGSLTHLANGLDRLSVEHCIRQHNCKQQKKQRGTCLLGKAITGRW